MSAAELSISVADPVEAGREDGGAGTLGRATVATEVGPVAGELDTEALDEHAHVGASTMSNSSRRHMEHLLVMDRAWPARNGLTTR
jgi:hypothetical protein